MDGQPFPVPPHESNPKNARTFTSKAMDRWGMTGIGVLFFLGAAAVPFFLENDRSPLSLAILCIAVGLMFLFLGEFVLKRRRLVLTDESAEFRTFLGTRGLDVSAIKGFRRGGGDDSPTLELVPSEPGVKTLSIPLTLKGKDEIVAWAAARFPDLDAIEMRTNLEAILANEEFGFTVEERQAFLNRQLFLFKILSGAGVAVSLWAMLFPRPYEVAMIALGLVLLASMGCGALGRGLMDLMGTDKSRPAAAIGIVLPGIVLTGRAMLDFNFDSWQAPLLPIAIATALVALLILVCFRETRETPSGIGAAFLVALLVGTGAVLQLNVLTDSGEATICESRVLDKRVSSGKSETYTLVLAPWKVHENAGVEYTSEKELYDAVDAGQTVWVWTKPGAFRIPWYFVTTPKE